MNPQQLEQLLGDLLREHGPALRMYAATWCHSPDDCVQRALIQLAGQNPLPENKASWLFRVVRNEAISQSRSERRRRRRELQVIRRGLLEDNEKSDWDCELIESALGKLAEDLREIVIARIWGELTFDEIAKIARCSSSAAHRRFEKGIQQLRDELHSATEII